MAKNTVEVIRAQFLPALFICGHPDPQPDADQPDDDEHHQFAW